MATKYHSNKKSQNYNVRVYHCNNCNHIFHTLSIGLENDLCTKCNKRSLSIIDKYKSKNPPRASGKKNNWLTKWDIYEHAHPFSERWKANEV